MIAGQVAVITGAGRGIGKAVAMELAKHGCNTALLSRSHSGVQMVAEQFEELGGTHRAYQCDPTDLSRVNECSKQISEDLGVNNAGMISNSIILRQSLDDFNSTLSANLTSAWIMSKVFVRFMVQQNYGSIVNIGSVIGLDGQQGQVAYSTAKAGLLGLTKSLSKEYGSRGIRVNMVAPGFIDTSMIADISEAVKQNLVHSTSLKRIGSPAEIATVVKFLLSPDSSFITGQCLRTDGGLSMPLLDSKELTGIL